MKNQAIILEADDWEGLFINGELVQEGHLLNEGKSRLVYFVKLSKTYNFDLEKIKEFLIEDYDERYLEDNGGFPKNINELRGTYK
jgi:hypothetical protein